MNFEEFKLKILSAADDVGENFVYIESLLENIFIGKGLPHFNLLNSFVVRSTVNTDKPKEAVFTNVRRCSYPPDEYKRFIKLQRANYPEQQVFYCTYPSETTNSSASLTCIVETAWEYITDLNKGRIYTTLSRWELKRPLNLWVVPFSELCCSQNPEYKRISDQFLRVLTGAGLEGSETLQTLRFLSDMFCEKENKNLAYRITSAFYNYLLLIEIKSGQIMDGLLYPSANTGGAGLNLVLKKDLIDNKILNCSDVVMYVAERNNIDLKRLNVFNISDPVQPDSNGDFRFQSIW